MRDGKKKKMVIGNLFTHVAPIKSSQELVYVYSRSNRNLAMLVFEERGKPEYPEQGENQQTQLSYDARRRVRIEPRTHHLLGGSCIL